MNSIVKFFHELFNPHCLHCKDELICKQCEMLRDLLEQEKFEKTKLLNSILNPILPARVEADTKDIQPIQLGSKHIPWKIRREALEQADRENAMAKAKYAAENPLPSKSVEELEKELEINHG